MKLILRLAPLLFLGLPGLSHAQIVADSGFAIRSVPTDQIAVGPADTVGSPWTFSSAYADAEGNVNESGIAPNGTQNLSDAPNGQAAFLQDVSSIGQSIQLTSASAVSITFDWEGRTPVNYDNETTGQDQITVSLGGILLFTGTPDALANIGQFQLVSTESADFLAGNYQLVFSGTSSGVSTQTFTDDMTFIDNIRINVAPVPEPTSLGLIVLGGLTLLALGRVRCSKSQK